MALRTYSELSKLSTFQERFEYLKLGGGVGKETFGFDRYINQHFYNNPEWKSVRRKVIIRDNGCDLGVSGYELTGRILIHHMNPITVDDIVNRSQLVFNPEYLICVSHKTHNAIHYGTDSPEEKIVERRPNDTTPWR